MGIQDLQAFLESECPDACKPVDLLKISREFVGRPSKRRGPNRLCLVVDAESCLHRLYGGFYADWACGGEWNRMRHFLTNLMRACQSANLELVMFFNGALEAHRMNEWAEMQTQTKKNIGNVLRHVYNKATPPPKIWWVAPSGLRVALRMALRQMGIPVACSMDDHQQEVIAYCRENSFHGLVAQDADYAVFDPPHYFSSDQLKLTYRGALDTVEYIIDEVAKSLDLHPKRFCVLAALLGTHILPETELRGFLCRICDLGDVQDVEKLTPKEKIFAVVNYVRSLPAIDDLDAIAKNVFSGTASSLDEKVSRFRQSVQYYVNGTQEGFLKYKPRPQTRVALKQPGSYPNKGDKKSKAVKTDKVTVVVELDAAGDNDAILPKEETEFTADSVYMEAPSGYSNGLDVVAATPAIIVEPPGVIDTKLTGDLSQDPADVESKFEVPAGVKLENFSDDYDEIKEAGTILKEEFGTVTAVPSQPCPPVPSTLETHTSSSSSSTGSSPLDRSPDVHWTLTAHKSATPSYKEGSLRMPKSNGEKAPKVPHEIMRVASERHQKGLMSPWIYQLLSQREIKLSVVLEDDNSRELPLAAELFRPLRQRVYGILFDLTKQMVGWRKNLKNTNNGQYPAKPEVKIREWILPRGREVHKPHYEMVDAEALEWLVPGIHRLWLGDAVEDKNRRLQALLTSLGCDIPMLLNTTHVPQHLLVMCCVLRYMLVCPGQRVLRRHELEAFLAASISPLLHDVEMVQEMKLPMLTVRGVQLAALFMQGVEHVVFANDACGAPIPWGACCPWHFFDGKLFHLKLLKADNGASVIDLCDGQVEGVMRVERMRHAILQGLQPDVVFAKPILPLMPQMYPPQSHMNVRPAGAPLPVGRGGGRGRGLLGKCPPMFKKGNSPMDARGGQLQIAGIVVGNWGGNTQGTCRPGGRGTHVAPPPHVMSVGPRRNGGRSAALSSQGMRGSYRRPGGFSCGPPPTQVSANQFYGNGYRGMRKKTKSGKGRVQGQADITKVTLEQRTKTGSGGRGRGCTVENPSDSTVLAISELMKATEITTTTTDTDPSSDLEQGQSDVDIYEDANEEGVKTECAAPVNGMNSDVPFQCELTECVTVSVKSEPVEEDAANKVAAIEETAIKATEAVMADGLTS